MAGPVTLRTEAGEEELDLAELEARVRRGEVSPQSLVRVDPITQGAFVPACDLPLYQRALQPRQAVFMRTFGFSRFPTATTALVLANLAIFLGLEGGAPVARDLVEAGAKVGPLILDLGQLWRLVTANLLHHDAWHIGLNLFVLFHVGGALENIYRLTDYLWLLLLGGLGSMATSLALSDGITAGASGLVFACLGCLVAFGLRYRALLPSRYQSILGEAAIPTVVLLFLIGFTSRGVDTWAHAGGLATGLALGTVLIPRSLASDDGRPSLHGWLRIGAVLLGLWLPAAAWEPVLEPVREDAWGLTLSLPAGWLRSVDPLGALAFTNGLAESGRATVAVDQLETPEGGDPRVEAARFVAHRLTPEALGDDVLRVRQAVTSVGTLAERDAVRVRAVVEHFGESRRLEAWFLGRGRTVLQLVATWPASVPGYEAVLARVAESVTLDEPRPLRLARARSLLFPGRAPTLEQLGAELLREGDLVPARRVLEGGAGPTARALLATQMIAGGEVDDGCALARSDEVQEPLPREPEAELSLARALCAWRLGARHQALRLVDLALSRSPGHPALEALAGRLRTPLQ